MRKRHKNRSTPVTSAISWTMILGLLFVVLHMNAIMVADSWSDYRTQGDVVAFSESGRGAAVHINPSDHNAPDELGRIALDL